MTCHVGDLAPRLKGLGKSHRSQGLSRRIRHNLSHGIAHVLSRVTVLDWNEHTVYLQSIVPQQIKLKGGSRMTA